jgi:hypothetical protein
MPVFYLERSGGFLAGDTTTGVVCFAPPGSPSAGQARFSPARIARRMVETMELPSYDMSNEPGRRAAKQDAEWLSDLRAHGQMA